MRKVLFLPLLMLLLVIMGLSVWELSTAKTEKPDRAPQIIILGPSEHPWDNVHYYRIDTLLITNDYMILEVQIDSAGPSYIIRVDFNRNGAASLKPRSKLRKLF